MGRFGGTSHVVPQTARMAVGRPACLDVSTGQIGFAETVSAGSELFGRGWRWRGFLRPQATSEGEFLGQVMRKTAQGVVNLMVSQHNFPLTIIQVAPDGTALPQLRGFRSGCRRHAEHIRAVRAGLG